MTVLVTGLPGRIVSHGGGVRGVTAEGEEVGGAVELTDTEGRLDGTRLFTAGHAIPAPCQVRQRRVRGRKISDDATSEFKSVGFEANIQACMIRQTATYNQYCRPKFTPQGT